MASKLVLKNSSGNELTINNLDGIGSKDISVQDFKFIRDTLKDISTIKNPNDGDILLVKGYHAKGDDGYGTFIWYPNEDKTNHNGGTIIDPTKIFPSDWNNEAMKEDWFNNTNTDNGCWKRLYNGTINVKWFGAKVKDDLKYVFNSSDYEYFIPHTFNYGFSTLNNKNIFTEIVLPNKDFIVYDNSIDNNYSDTSHQGGQIRKFLVSKDANEGQHNSFEYITSEHHPGIMYNIQGNGLDNDGYLGRNATTFFHTLKTGFEWGIGSGGTSIKVADTNNVTQEEELEANGFKLIASGLYGNLGLTNILNISLKNGYFGFMTGAENQIVRYDFYMEDDPNNSGSSNNYSMYLRTDDDNQGSNLLIGNKTNYTKLNYDVSSGGLMISDKNGKQCLFSNNSFIAQNTEYILYLSKGSYTGIKTYNSGASIGFITKEGSTKFTIESDEVEIDQVAILLPNIPTSDPSVAGQLWNDSGTVKISAG